MRVFHQSHHPVVPDRRPLDQQPIIYETLPTPVAQAFGLFNFKTWADVENASVPALLMFNGFGHVCVTYVRDELLRRSGNPFHCERRSLEAPPYRPRALRRSDMPTRSGVYFLKCSQLVKIGSAKDIRERFRTIWRMNPFPLDLLGVVEPTDGRTPRQVECEFHRRFRRLREFGEWFRYEAELRDFCYTLEHSTRERDYLP